MIIRTAVITAASAMALGFALVPLNSEAATSRITYRSATNACHAVNPAQADDLRFRHLGVFNAGASAVQIACSLDTELVGDQDTGQITLSIHNFRTGATTINCTVSAGNRYIGTNTYPMTINLPAKASTHQQFSNIDKINTSNFMHYNIVCVLPPNVELSTLRLRESDADDGL